MHVRILCFLLATSFSLFAQTLIPGTQVAITNDASVNSPVYVSGNSSGFMSVWQDNSQNIQSSFCAAGGTSWATPVQIASNSSYLATVAGNSTGFVVVWINVPPGGFNPGNVYSAFSDDLGVSWSVNEISGAGGEAWVPVNVAATEAGFMAVWIELDGGAENVWASFSSDGTTWNSPVEVYGGGDTVQGILCGIAGNSSGFVVTWVTDSSGAFSSFSSDNGMTWSTPSEITDDLASEAFGPQVCASADAFMAVWQDGDNNLQSSLSTDNGSTWDTPIQAAENLLAVDSFVGFSSNRFIAFWHGGDNNADGSLSSDGGNTWSTTAITNDGSVNSGYWDFFVSGSAASTGAMFVWVDIDQNAQSNFATFSSSAPNPPTSLAGVQQKHSFGTLYELYNTLQWGSSLSDDVAAYYVFRNGTLIAMLGASAISYQDHNQPKGAAVSYAVTAVDGEGNQSTPVDVTIY